MAETITLCKFKNENGKSHRLMYALSILFTYSNKIFYELENYLPRAIIHQTYRKKKKLPVTDFHRSH